MDDGPGAEGSPSLGDHGGGVLGAVAPRMTTSSAANGPRPLISCTVRMAWSGFDRAQCCGVQPAFQGGVRDGVKILALAAGQFQLKLPQRLRGGKGVGFAVVADEVVAQPGGLDDADTLGQHGPGRGFVRGSGSHTGADPAAAPGRRR